MHNKCTKVTKGVDIRYINAIFSPTQSDNRIIADIAGKEIVTICMFLGIIITAALQP